MTKLLQYIEIDTPSFANLAGNAAAFSSGNRLTRDAGLTGAVDSKQLTFSAWVRVASGAGGRLIAAVSTLGGGDSRTRVVLTNPSNTFEITGTNPAGADVVKIGTTAGLSTGSWAHVIGSVDLTDADKRHIYVDDVEATLIVTTYTDEAIDFTLADWGIAARPDGSAQLTGDIAFLWFAPGVYIDLSLEANRRKFISDIGTPVDLGDDGSAPTGIAPLVYLAGKIGTWGTNKGTGGGFTTTGELAAVAEEEQIWRFAVPTEYLPRDIECIPSITGISHNPAAISLGENLGQRATLSVTFKDHRHIMNGESFDRGTFWGKWRGRYGTRLRGRSLRFIRGQLGQTIEQMETWHYVIDSVSGPTPDGAYTIKAQDVLMLLNDDRALAPRPTNGFLNAAITNIATSATLGPAGIGNFEYPASGYVNLGGKEVCAFTRSNDTLTLTRATTIPSFSYETEVVAHDAGTRVQLCLPFIGEDAADIIATLFIDFGEVPSEFISLATWQLETATYLATVYTTLITEPTGVNKLASELVQQAALAIWWDALTQDLRLQVLRPIATTAAMFDEDSILTGSLSTKEQPDSRLSEVLVYFGLRNPLKPIDQGDNYRSGLLTLDPDADTEYGGRVNRTVHSRWIPFGGSSVAERLSNILLGRFRDPPRRMSFDTWRLDSNVPQLGGGYQLAWTANQDKEGNPEFAPIQVTKLGLQPDRFEVEAEEMLFTDFGTVDNNDRVVVIDASVNNINLRTLHDNLFAELTEDDLTASPPVTVTFIINDGVIVGSDSTASPACDAGDWITGFTPLLRVLGRIQGHGGKGGNGKNSSTGLEAGFPGGPALYTRTDLDLDTEQGEIWGGGGGGGGGNPGAGGGGGGGGGAGKEPGAGGQSVSGAPDHGDPGTTEAGGAGAELLGSANDGGDGGNPGEAGQDGQGGGPPAGGAAGAAIDGVSFVNFQTSPVGDIRGPQVN